MKKILVINGNPVKGSYGEALAKTYIEGAKKSGAQVKTITLYKEKFAMLKYGTKKEQKLEPGLKKAQEALSWADHYVFVYPTWWGAPPALLKGFIERVFTPGFAYKFKKSGIPEQLLKGKSATLLITMDAPPFFYKRVIGAPGDKMMKRGILRFCGVKPVKLMHIGSVKMSNAKKRKDWLKKVKKLGEQQK